MEFSYKESVGSYLQRQRQKKNISLERIAKETKISLDVLQNLEKNNLDIFPSEVHAKGIITNYAQFIGAKKDLAIGLFKRDKEETLNQQKRNSKTTITSRILIVLFFFMVFGWLTGMSIGLLEKALQPPKLQIFEPQEIIAPFDDELEFEDNTITLFGNVSGSSTVIINEEPISIKPGGYFESASIPLINEINIIEIQAENQIGRTSTILLRIPKNEKNLIQEETEVIVTVTQSGYVLVRSDGIIVYNDVAGKGESISFVANQNFSIESENPESTIVIYDNQEERLQESITNFSLE